MEHPRLLEHPAPGGRHHRGPVRDHRRDPGGGGTTYDFSAGKWNHFPETVGRGVHICGGCIHSEPRVEFVGIGTVRHVKGVHDCMLEPNQRRVVSDVIRCEAFEARPNVPVQRTLEAWM